MSKHKNTRKQRKNRFNQSCLDFYLGRVNLGRKKRYARQLAKAGKTV